MSQMSGPLFTEDSASSDEDQQACDTEVNNITRQRTPSQATIVVMSPQGPVSTATMDYSTQGDPALAVQIPTQTLLHTNNFFIPDGTPMTSQINSFMQDSLKMDTMHTKCNCQA